MNIIDSFNNLCLNDNRQIQQINTYNHQITNNKPITGYYNYNSNQEKPIIIISFIDQ